MPRQPETLALLISPLLLQEGNILKALGYYGCFLNNAGRMKCIAGSSMAIRK